MMMSGPPLALPRPHPRPSPSRQGRQDARKKRAPSTAHAGDASSVYRAAASANEAHTRRTRRLRTSTHPHHQGAISGAVFSFSRDRSRCGIKSCNPKNQIWDKSRNQWYLSHSGCGIKSGIHTTFLARNCGSTVRLGSRRIHNPCRKPPNTDWASRSSTS
jgi:hypothetical protein